MPSYIAPLVEPSAPAAAEVCPCDGCIRRADCRVRKLACGAFSMYMAGEQPSRWRSVPKVPTALIYSALFDPVRPVSRRTVMFRRPVK